MHSRKTKEKDLLTFQWMNRMLEKEGIKKINFEFHDLFNKRAERENENADVKFSSISSRRRKIIIVILMQIFVEN